MPRVSTPPKAKPKADEGGDCDAMRREGCILQRGRGRVLRLCGAAARGR